MTERKIDNEILKPDDLLLTLVAKRFLDEGLEGEVQFEESYLLSLLDVELYEC